MGHLMLIHKIKFDDNTKYINVYVCFCLCLCVRVSESVTVSRRLVNARLNTLALNEDESWISPSTGTSNLIFRFRIHFYSSIFFSC